MILAPPYTAVASSSLSSTQNAGHTNQTEAPPPPYSTAIASPSSPVSPLMPQSPPLSDVTDNGSRRQITGEKKIATGLSRSIELKFIVYFLTISIYELTLISAEIYARKFKAVEINGQISAAALSSDLSNFCHADCSG